MADRGYRNIKDLVIWSDNPRNGPLGEEDFSEKDIINILIEVVGIDKMFNLIADIFASKGLMGNVNPVVVLENEKYYVYDGNRRISALKILKSPDIIEDVSLKNRVKKLVKDEDVSFTNEAFVYITDKEEALEIMDKTHSGEQQGVGMIPWEPYQRDISLVRRSKNPLYPNAYKVAESLNYNNKSFDKIHYTDLDRLFSSTTLRNHFGLIENSLDFSSKLQYIIGMLIKYKEKKRFKSFSRQFNTTNNSSDAPIIEFCNWVDEQEKNKKNFYFRTNSVVLYTDQKFDFNQLNLKIIDSQKNEISYKIEDFDIKYFNPNGIEKECIDISDTGTWEISLKFKDELHTEKIEVKKLLQPRMEFDSKKLFGQGNTINLRNLLIHAFDGHGCDCKDKVKISIINQGSLINDTFSMDNPIGSYQVAYSFVDVTGSPYSKTKEITIIDQSNPLLSENKSRPLLSFNGKCSIINISPVVNELVSEINNLEIEKNICILSTALRSLLELSFDELQNKSRITFKHKDLQKRIDEFKDLLLTSKLNDICKLYNTELHSYKTEKNAINLIDSIDLSSCLNLAAHKSIARIDITKITQIAQKNIAPILVYISLILR